MSTRREFLLQSADYFGYEWPVPQYIGVIAYHIGTADWGNRLFQLAER